MLCNSFRLAYRWIWHPTRDIDDKKIQKWKFDFLRFFLLLFLEGKPTNSKNVKKTRKWFFQMSKYWSLGIRNVFYGSEWVRMGVFRIKEAFRTYFGDFSSFWNFFLENLIPENRQKIAKSRIFNFGFFDEFVRYLCSIKEKTCRLVI